ncbi:MAG: hypothetical protein JNL80_14790 [Phycisphaerae bacterium]|jgi:hypothetical protein|nr:hypothetical protein [Phycisphaerae bacterium]
MTQATRLTVTARVSTGTLQRPVPTSLRRQLGALGAAVFATSVLWTTSAFGQVAKVLDKLNEPWSRVVEENKSWKPILTAALDITESPKPIDAKFDLASIWPGMDKWSDWSAWAEKNAAMGKALLANQDKIAFCMPYGEEKLDQALRSKGFSITINLEADGKKTTFGYFKAIATINAYAVAEMYRLGEAGKFEEAFALGIASAKVLRQLADQTMLDEKLFALDSLSTVLSIHRDFAYTYLEKIPADLFRKVGSKDYPLIRPQDGERLRRLEMPEGDRFVAEGVLGRCFDDRGQPSEALFADVFAGLQSQGAELTRFGAAKRWSKIATLHGSLDASVKILNEVYDDWWRRWRYRPYDPATLVPTRLSQLNSIRYAAVLLAVIDINDAFKARLRTSADLNGTATAIAVCGYKRANGQWPDDIEKAFPIFGQKRLNFDPYDRDFGTLLYKDLGTGERRIDTPQGNVTATGCLIYARGVNNEDDGAKTSDPTAEAYDVLYWPPLRAVSRSSKG